MCGPNSSFTSISGVVGTQADEHLHQAHFDVAERRDVCAALLDRQCHVLLARRFDQFRGGFGIPCVEPLQQARAAAAA